MQPLLNYVLSILPALAVMATLLAVIPQSLTALRIVLHIIFFVLARDAMTPQGFWQVAAGSLRFTAPANVLLALATLSASLIFVAYWLEQACRDRIVWRGRNLAMSVAAGIAGALIVSVLAATLKHSLALPNQPAPAANTLPLLLVFALAANAYEEFLFRGLLQGELARRMTALKAALVSGLMFCLCHSFLATTVTNIGLPIYIFTLIEGIVAGLVYIRGGLVAATLAHGGAIFLLSSGIY